MNDEENDPILDAVVALVPPLLNTLDALQFIGRHLHPPHLQELIAAVGARDDPLREGLDLFQRAEWPEHLVFIRDRLELSATSALNAFDGLRAATQSPNAVFEAYRSLRQYTRAVEALYPLAPMLPAVNRFFLEERARSDEALRAAGAKVVYREIADLSHTYPREENAAIMDWLLG